jgi:toxin CptA
MSIAVSAIIVRSRLLRRVWLCYGAANLGAAGALAAGLAPARLLPLGVCGCVLAGTLLLRRLAAGETVRRIDISGLGQLRLTVQQGIGGPDAQPELVRLLPGSTLWPGLMLLRLQRENGKVERLALLPDSIEAGQFRCVSVAIRDISSRTT